MQMPTTKQNHHQSNNSVSYTQPILEALLILLIVVGWPLAVHYELFYSVFGLRVLDNALRESLIVQKAAVFGGAQSVASLCQFKAASMEHPSVEGETLFMMKLYANSSICMDHFNNDKTYCDEQVARIARFRARHTVTQLKADLKESAVLSNRACATLVAMAVRDVALRFTDQWLLSNLAWLPRPLNPAAKYVEALRVLDKMNKDFPVGDTGVSKEHGVPDNVLKFLCAGIKEMGRALNYM